MRSNHLTATNPMDRATHKQHPLRNSGEGQMTGRLPLSNIRHSETEVTLEIALPGIDKDRVLIKQKGGNLFVEVAPRSAETSEGKSRFIRREFHDAYRTIKYRLADDLDMDIIQAEMTNGVLVVSIPKIDKSKLIKSIEIK